MTFAPKTKGPMRTEKNLAKSLLAAKAGIYSQQKVWAVQRGLNPDANGWLASSDDNLIRSLSPTAHAAFTAGAGDELQGKMRATHSSSALAYNMFAPAESDGSFQAAIAELLGIPVVAGSAPATVGFEVKRPTGWSGIPPHLDVEVRWPCQAVAIESKFSELFEAEKAVGRSLTPYLGKIPRTDRRWLGLGPLFDLATALDEGTRTFSILDAPQLIKHMLGLWNARRRSDLDAGVTLALAWYDVSEREPLAKPACDALRIEFDVFASAVNPCFDVRMFTHQDLFRAYERSVPASDARLSWLRSRYF